MAVLDVLKKSKLFVGMDTEDLQGLAAICETRDLTRGQTLFTEGTPSDALYLVAQGTIAIRKSGDAGSETDVSKIGAGGHFGEMAMLTTEAEPERRSSGAEASELTQVIEIPYVALTKFLDERPQRGFTFYRNIAITLGGRIRKTTEDLAGLRSLRLRST